MRAWWKIHINKNDGRVQSLEDRLTLYPCVPIDFFAKVVLAVVMRLSFSFLGLALLAATSTAEAFVPRSSTRSSSAGAALVASRGGGALDAATAASATEVPTSPIAGMRPGTSGLRKKVEVWQGDDDANRHYVENFIQSLVDTAKASEGGKLDT